MSEHTERTDGWEEAVQHILEVGNASIQAKTIMRQLGEMTGSYYLGLVDAGLTPDQISWRVFEFLIAFIRAKKDGLI